MHAFTNLCFLGSYKLLQSIKQRQDKGRSRGEEGPASEALSGASDPFAAALASASCAGTAASCSDS